MEMRATEDIEIGEDISGAIQALCYCLLDSSLLSHCSACFSPLPSRSPLPLRLLFCRRCSSHSSSSSSSAADSHLLHSRASLYPHGDSSDLRLALRLLHSIPDPPRPSAPLRRIAGLLTNRSSLTTSPQPQVVSRIRDGARAMAAATRGLEEGDDADVDVALEEAALSLVMTNAVEVQDKSGRTLGLALFPPSFCFINHSCSPNACYRTSLSSAASPETPSSSAGGNQLLRIVPHSCGGNDDNQAVRHRHLMSL